MAGVVLLPFFFLLPKALFNGLMSLKPKVAVAWSLKEEQHEQIPGGFLVTQVKQPKDFTPKKSRGFWKGLGLAGADLGSRGNGWCG